MSEVQQISNSQFEQLFRRFYERFQVECAVLQQQLKSATEPAPTTEEQRQLTLLLLNRLMLLYFIQRHGLFENDHDYLVHQLQLSQQRDGPDLFYRRVLAPLFTATPALPVPMVRAQLFRERTIEQRYPQLLIANSAFSRLFAFFECYQWQLERQPDSCAETLTPDILGYIFEQSANQQQMGTYYTRSDIADYIAGRTILPFYLEAIARQKPALCAPNSTCWHMLQTHPNRYIYASIRAQDYLPGETLHDYTQRQQQYQELRTAIAQGRIQHIDDLIQTNLNIQQFTYDLLANITEPATLQVCYEQLTALTILDPTCGAGVFLLAALHLLLPLYELCHTQCQRYRDLQTILRQNLYGVDIMPEATEICQQRLLLTLIAQTQGQSDLENLPQLEQTIQTGDALAPLLCATQQQNDVATTATGPATFNWYAAFPAVFASGGFSAIIGNPPYVEYSPKNSVYSLQHFSTYRCANLYTCVVERSHHLLSPHGRSGMILPLAAFATRNMQTFLAAFRHWFPVSWISFYHFRPAMLFSGGKMASIPTAIFLGKASGTEQRFSTRLHKWTSEQRPHLFTLLHYHQVTAPPDPVNAHYYPKIGHPCENGILSKLLTQQVVSTYITRHPDQAAQQNTMYYRTAGGLYWKIFLNFPWPYRTTSNKQCYFHSGYDRDVFVALYNSSLFWWYYTVTFDTFNLKDYMLFGFRFSYPDNPHTIQLLRHYSQQLMADFQRYSKHLKRGNTGSYTIYARKSKDIIDAIDHTLAQHYGINEEELNFILHYDLKYRLGPLPPTAEKV